MLKCLGHVVLGGAEGPSRRKRSRSGGEPPPCVCKKRFRSVGDDRAGIASVAIFRHLDQRPTKTRASERKVSCAKQESMMYHVSFLQCSVVTRAPLGTLMQTTKIRGTECIDTWTAFPTLSRHEAPA